MKFNKNNKKKGKKKGKGKFSIKKLLASLLVCNVAFYVCFVAVGVIGALMFMASTTGMSLWGDEIHELPEEDDGKCECGCVWVSNDGGNQSVTVDTSTAVNNNGVTEMKLLGKAEISHYSPKDSGTITSSGTTVLPGTTAAVGFIHGKYAEKSEKQMGYSNSDNVCILNDIWVNKINNEFGGSVTKSSPYYWVYVEGLGVRAVLDKCGIGHRLDIYTNDEDPDRSKIESLNNKSVNVYYLGDIDDVHNLTPPTVNTSSVTVPSYGASTGSLTNTSTNEVPVVTDANSKALLEHLLPGAVVASQYYNVHIRLLLGLAPNEGGWAAVRDGASHEYHIFSLDSKGPMTGKVISSGRWSSHEDYNDAVLHYATNYKITNHSNNEFNGAFSGEGYKAVLDAYSKGAEEQVLRHALSGFNNYRESGASTAEEYRAAAENYAKKILSITSKFPQINDIDVAMKYMEQNGLMDEYQEALKMKDRYEALYADKYGQLANAVPNGGGNIQQSTQTPGTGNGYWLCVCKRPCSICHCHDNETGNENSNNPDITNGVFSQPKAGTASGLWGTAEELEKYIDSLNTSNIPLGCSNVNQLKSNLKKLLPLIGTQSVTPFSYEKDRFKGSDGLGFITYSQSSSLGIEPYLKNSYNDATSTTLGSSGCGIYSVAMVLSTLEKKWVNPAEVAIALQTYGVRNNKRINTTCMGGAGAAYGTGLKALLEEIGYTVKYNSGSVDMNMVDDCLDKGGCFIYVVGSHSGLTSGGHYVVVRERLENGNYLMGNSTRRNNNEFSRDTIKQYASSTSENLYIYPRVNIATNNSSSSGGSSAGASTGSKGNDIIAEARVHLEKGVMYQWGGTSPSTGFDCSGLVQWCYAKAGITVPRVAQDQYNSSRKITKDELQPGDLVFGSSTKSTSNITHVMIYIGNNTVIHAPRTGKPISEMNLDYYGSEIAYGTYLH